MRRVVVHLGTPKTGTRSVQRWLRRHTDDLAAVGVDYPDLHAVVPPAVRLNQSDLFVWLAGLPSRLGERAEEVGERLRNSSAQTLLLSSEACWLLPGRSGRPHADPRDFIEAVLGWLERELDREPTFVVYVRRPDHFVLSLFNQYVKNAVPWSPDGLPATFDRFWREHLTYARYDERLAAWRSAVGAERLVVRALEPAAYVHGDLRHDFADACGFAPPAADPALEAPGSADSDDENRSWGALALTAKFAANRDLDSVAESRKAQARIVAALGADLSRGSLLDLVGSGPIDDLRAALDGSWEATAETLGLLDTWSRPWTPGALAAGAPESAAVVALLAEALQVPLTRASRLLER